MMLRLYSIYDSGVSAYLKPFWSDHKANAIRSFIQCVNDKSNPDNMIAMHPDQFTLFELGVFDSNSGQYIAHEISLSCGKALEYVNTN
jgi:hypothetical protein